MSEKEELEERIAETVKATGSSVVAKGREVKEYRDKSEASEEEKKKAIEENVIGELDSDHEDPDSVGDGGDVRSGGADD